MIHLFKKILKEDNFLSLSGNVIIAVFGFAGFSLLARSLSPDDFAEWVILISAGSLIEMLRYGISSNALVRFLSSASAHDEDRLIGSNVFLSLMISLALALLMILINYQFETVLLNSSYALFFKWYPMLVLLNLPMNNALAVQQAKMEYGHILFIRSVGSSLFFLIVLLSFVAFEFTIDQIALAYTVITGVTSAYCIYKSWDGIKHLRKVDRHSISELLQFGKYSTFTLIGTNLLRNADIFIISISPFGNAAVALFSIPLKLTELQQIPLRSFTATAFPKMSRASIEGRINEVKDLFNVYSGVLTYLFVLISLVTFLFAKEFIILVSGYQYLDTELYGIDIVLIVKILSVYGLLLPLDRMTGIGLDSINQPNINALKVFLMLGLNIIGDLVSVYVFESIEMVAITTLIFTFAGILIGCFFLSKSFKISIIEIIKSTNHFYKELLTKLT